MNALHLTLAADFHHARRAAATMRKAARRYAEGGAQWLAYDAMRRAHYFQREARAYIRRLRMVRS